MSSYLPEHPFQRFHNAVRTPIHAAAITDGCDLFNRS
jgi:hypothetical protein